MHLGQFADRHCAPSCCWRGWLDVVCPHYRGTDGWVQRCHPVNALLPLVRAVGFDEPWQLGRHIGQSLLCCAAFSVAAVELLSKGGCAYNRALCQRICESACRSTRCWASGARATQRECVLCSLRTARRWKPRYMPLRDSGHPVDQVHTPNSKQEIRRQKLQAEIPLHTIYRSNCTKWQ